MSAEDGGHEWLEFPDPIPEASLPHLVRELEGAGVPYRALRVLRPASLPHQAEAEPRYELQIRADHGRLAGRILARALAIFDPRADTEQSGACLACGATIVDSLRCPDCGINVGSSQADDDPAVVFIRELGGFVDEDRERLLDLAECGIDLSRPVEVAVALWPDDERSARSAGAAARQAGCEVEVVRLESGLWQCRCTRRMVATYEAVTALHDELAAIAEVHDAGLSPWYVDDVACRLEQCDAVATAGDRLVPFEFWAELDDERAATDMWSRAKTLGFRARMAPVDGEAWECVCESRLPPTAAAVREFMATFQELCRRFGARFTAWGPADSEVA